MWQIYREQRSVTATNYKILAVTPEHPEDGQDIPTYKTAKLGYHDYMSIPIL
jgi:hypothetical protein